jgi:2-haloacid dehalogenase
MTTINDIKACVFDAYGTLFDVHSAVGRQRTRLGDNAERISALWRTKQLEYTWLRSLMRRHTDFWQITHDALDYALDSFDIADTDLRDDLMQAYLQLSCYPEVPGVLAGLKQNGMRNAILSNGSPAMLQAAVANAGLEDRFDHVLSVEDAGIFKPDPKVYQLAVDRLGVAPQQICFQSSNAWDAAGAASFGFRVAWINRFGQRRERLPLPPDAELKTLSELPSLLGLPAIR